MSSAKQHACAAAPCSLPRLAKSRDYQMPSRMLKQSVDQEPTDLHPKPKRQVNFQLRCILAPRAHLIRTFSIDITSIDPNPARLSSSPSPSPAPSYQSFILDSFSHAPPPRGIRLSPRPIPSTKGQRTSQYRTHARRVCHPQIKPTSTLVPFFPSPSLPRNSRIGRLLCSSHRNPKPLISACVRPRSFPA